MTRQQPPESGPLAGAVHHQRKLWDRMAPHYDRQIRFWERVLFGDTRAWCCSQATGDVLEVAIGTGRNLPFYPDSVRLTGIDLSPAMLEIAQSRVSTSSQDVELHEGDAHALPFADTSFDTVVCTFSLCNIPDERTAIAEMQRVLRPGGRLILADHVASTSRFILAAQRLLEKLTFRFAGDHQTRRPFPLVVEAGFLIENHERYTKGVVERVVARKQE